MNEAVKWMMTGMLPLSFHADFIGIPMAPGIVGCLVLRSDFRVLEREGNGEGFEQNRKIEQTDRLWLDITILDLILAVFMRQSIGTSIQIMAVLILTEIACGYSTLNHYGELGRQYTQGCRKGLFSLGYLIWMITGLTSYEYLAVLRGGEWNIAGAVCVIIGHIMLVKGLAAWAPGEKTEY